MALSKEEAAKKVQLFERGLKKCCKCQSIKPLEEFYNNKAEKDGKNDKCIVCAKEWHRLHNINGPGNRKKRKRTELLAQGLKECARCNGIKPIEQFAKRKASSDGLRSWCKECQSAYKKEYRSDPKNAATEQAQSRKWRRANPERSRELAREWSEQNPERKRELKRRWHLANKESENAKANERMKIWARENPERHRNNAANRRAREAGAPGRFTKEQWIILKDLCEFRCVICGREKKLCRDHIIPLTHDDATNWISNIQPLCKRCNSAKQDIDRTDYRPAEAREWAIEETARQMQIEGYMYQPIATSPLAPHQLALGL